MTPFEVIRGDSSVILGQPHGGIFVPDEILTRLNARGHGLDDTDWHIGQLYDGLLAGATVVRANFHRYVIDANRNPNGQSLYPGQNTTSLCPETDFDGNAIWTEGQSPSADEVEARRVTYHAPYHAALAVEIERVKARNGIAILYDCHSIRSEIPFLFPGLLPVFSIGTAEGTTAAAKLEAAVVNACAGAKGFDLVVNGRFKGGWTTRHYGRPADGIHAIQMELAQRAYLAAEAPPWAYDSTRAKPLRAVLRTALAELERLALSGEINA